MWSIKEEDGKLNVYQDNIKLFAISNINYAYWKSIKPVIELSPDLFILFGKVVQQKKNKANT